MSLFGANTAAGGHHPPNTAFDHGAGAATGNKLAPIPAATHHYQMPHKPWHYPAPGYPPNELFYWAGCAHLSPDRYMPQSPYYHVGGGWFRPNPTFDPVAAGFGQPPPTVYVLGTGTKLIMHDEPPASGAEDVTMRNLAVTRAALTAPSKKEVERKVQRKRKSVRRRDGRVNLSIAQASKEMQT
jgi:hypothetical protein